MHQARDGMYEAHFGLTRRPFAESTDPARYVALAAHEAALRRIEQAGGKMISVPQLFCELQRDWARKDTVPAFMNLFIETGGTAGIQFSYDRTE